jgi:hypothetical protein
MTTQNGNIVRTATPGARPYGTRAGGGPQPANLGDILERVLDTGIVIAGDIRVNLLDIELLTIKLRLVIASVDTARQLGIDWWQNDPWLSSKSRQQAGGRELDAVDEGSRELAEENRRLRSRLAEIEGADGGELPRSDTPATQAPGQADTDD